MRKYEYKSWKVLPVVTIQQKQNAMDIPFSRVRTGVAQLFQLRNFHIFDKIISEGFKNIICKRLKIIKRHN